MDAAELLRLYLNYDLLEEAVELVLEYVNAVLGKGHQYFGIEVSSPAAGTASWGRSCSGFGCYAHCLGDGASRRNGCGKPILEERRSL